MTHRLTTLFKSAAMLTLALVVTLAVTFAGARVSLAQTPDSMHGAGSVHIHLHDTKDTVHPAGVRLSLFEVAQGSYFEHEAHLMPDFDEEQTHHDVDDIVNNSIDCAKDLEVWVEVTHHVDPLLTVASDSTGEVDFDGLEDGVYLVCQDGAYKEERDVEVSPFIVEVPMQTNSGALDYMIDCHPKIMLMSVDGNYCDVSVEKHWVDDNDARGIRPPAIDVLLLCDGKTAKTITLDASTNWTYTWEALDANHDWSVMEAEVPQGYATSVTHEGTSFYITNTIDPKGEVPPDGDDPSATPSKGTPTTGGASDSSSPATKILRSFGLPATGDPAIDTLVLTAFVAAVMVVVILVVLKRRKLLH